MLLILTQKSAAEHVSVAIMSMWIVSRSWVVRCMHHWQSWGWGLRSEFTGEGIQIITLDDETLRFSAFENSDEILDGDDSEDVGRAAARAVFFASSESLGRLLPLIIIYRVQVT